MKKLNYQSIKGRCLKAVIVLLLVPLSSWAQNLTVGGVEVTSGEYLVSDNIEGLVSFDVSTNTLTLNNATISGNTTTNGCITTSLSHLTISLIGENKIICSGDSVTAIRATAGGAILTIEKGADNCKLVFETERAIRDFKTVSFDGLFWNGAYTYQYNGGYRLMATERLEAGSSDDTGLSPTLTDTGLTMNVYYGQNFEPRLQLECGAGLPKYYSIDYASSDLQNQNVSAMQFTEAPELLGPCTVTAYVKSGNTEGTHVVGKFFGLAQSSAEAVAGQDEPVKPVIIPAIDEEESEELRIEFYTEIADEYKVASPDGAELYIASAGKANFEVRLFDYRETPSFIILNSFVQTDQEVPCYKIGNFNVSVREAVTYGIIVNGEEVDENNMLNVTFAWTPDETVKNQNISIDIRPEPVFDDPLMYEKTEGENIVIIEPYEFKDYVDPETNVVYPSSIPEAATISSISEAGSGSGSSISETGSGSSISETGSAATGSDSS